MRNSAGGFSSEGGKLLSGGERQRVSIARALLKKAPILLLDEAADVLDGVTAKAIRTTIESLRGQVTVLIIAHQAETIANADRVAFLEHGRISALGTHQELFASNPRTPPSGQATRRHSSGSWSERPITKPK